MLGDTLRSALPASDFPVKVTTYPIETTRARIKLVVIAELDRKSNPAGPMGSPSTSPMKKADGRHRDGEGVDAAPGQEASRNSMTAVVVDPGVRLKLAARMPTDIAPVWSARLTRG
jgi:hypothetical protein